MQTWQGNQVWELAMRAGGQLRATDYGVIGFDLTAVFALAGAMGVDPVAVAEWFPQIEQIAVAGMNARMKENSDG